MHTPFPPTRHSLISALADDSPETRQRAFGTLVEAYWKPVYAYTRLRWRANREDAEDLTQEFFARALEKEFFSDFDPSRARFRTFLRLCLDRFLSHQHQAASRLKRGGGLEVVSLDFGAAESQLGAIAGDDDPEAFFRREWARALIDRALQQLSTHRHYALFARYDLHDVETGPRPTYQDLAAEFDIPAMQVTNFLAAARREFRRIVLDLMRAQAGSDAEFREDARDLLGFDAP